MKKSREFIVTQIVSHLVCGWAALCALLPFALLFIASFTDNDWAAANGFTFFPAKWSVEAYTYLFTDLGLYGRAYLMTILVTAVGTSLSLALTTMYGYTISQTWIPGHSFLSFILVFTMLFGGGLVASYYVWTNYWHIKDTFWALVLPGGLMGAFNVILVRNYFNASVSVSLIEAARLDGAGEFKIFLKVVLPLSIPIIATIGLTTGLGYWNSWTNGLYYLTMREGSKYYTIQILLNNIQKNIDALKNMNPEQAGRAIKLPGTTIRLALAAVAIVPILFIYPIFQKYFVKGITLGGVKE